MSSDIESFDRAGTRALAIYSALGFVLFAAPLIGHFGSAFIGQGNDPSMFSWLLVWWPHAIANRLNPFFTTTVWAPSGVNVGWTPAFPLPAVVTAPLTAWFGPIVAFNLLCLIAPPLSAWTAFLLCQQLAKSWWPSLLGGYIFGFSAYVAGHQACGHPNLMLVFLVPLAALLIARGLSGEISVRKMTVALCATLVAQFLISAEVFATMAVAGAVILLLGWTFAPPESAARLKKVMPAILASFVLATLILSPYLVALMKWKPLHGGLWPADLYSIDLLNFFLPVPSTALGAIPFVERWTMPFRIGGSIAEMDGYIGLPLITIVVLYAWRRFREPLGRALVEFLIIFLILSLGPRLRIDNILTIGLPFKAFLNLPLLDKALPGRLMLYSFLALGLIAALWFESAKIDTRAKVAIALLIVISTLPTPSRRWITPADSPHFFADGTYRQYIKPTDNVFALPFGFRGASMLWHAQARMSFNLVGGYTGPPPEGFRQWPIAAALVNATFLPDATEQMAACMAHYGVTVALVSDSDPDAAGWNEILSALSIERHDQGGITMYRISRDALEPYRNVSSAEMTRRATHTAIDSLLLSANEWRLRGNDPVEFTPAKAVQARLLKESSFVGPNTIPGWSTGGPDQVMDTTLHLRAGAWLGGTPAGEFGIGLHGTYAALEPLVAEYRTIASHIYFPYPNDLLAPAAPTPAPASERLLTLVFSREQLTRAASSVTKSGTHAVVSMRRSSR